MSKLDKTDMSAHEMEVKAYNLGNEDVDDDCPNKKTHFYEFKEYNTIIRLVDSLTTNIKVLRNAERSFEQFLFICDQYQEQPHLIDPFLLELFEKLIEIVKKCIRKDDSIKNEQENDQIINECFKYMHCLAKMRGYKKIVQYLPHEINDFEPVLNLLARQNLSDVYTWQTRYLLLLWLSIVCIVPFDLKRFDANNQNQNESIMNRLLNTCIPYLFTSDKCQDASAFLLAKFMSRVDLRETVLPKFFEQLFQYLDDANKKGENIKVLGTLKCIASIYKYGKREDLLKYTLPTLEQLIKQDLLATSQLSIVRKFHIKIVQRIGTTFFKCKIAKWRYERGSRILMNNITKQEPTNVSLNKESIKSDELAQINLDDEKVPNEIEDIIEQLLFGIKDKDTIVRWSSAKGIGRITNRLPKDMAEDVLVSVLDLFTFVEDDSAWHGGCLAIAELGRRGLLLPQQLPTVVPIVLKALVFDKKLGNYSLGRNVRDAACYVCWSLARAFEADIIKPYVNQIAGTLLIVTVFDREVNCRRAASAAFQGIDILTICDYHAVGQLQNCYLNLSTYIASFDEYKQSIIDHLLEHKFNHWDPSIRELTSQALFKLTACCPDYIAFNVLPKLLKYSFSIDLNTRHGSLISLAELIHALCDEALKRNPQNLTAELKRFFPNEIISELKIVFNKIFDEKYFRGTGGELMRPAVCFVLKKLSISKLFQHDIKDTNMQTNDFLFNLDKVFLDESELFLNNCIEYNKESVQISAVETIAFYCDLNFFKFNSKSNDLNEELLKNSKIIQTYVSNLKSTSKEHIRSGYCLALSYLPKYLLSVANNFEIVVKELIIASKWKMGPIKEQDLNDSSPNEAGWVQARRDALKSITNLLSLIQSKEDLVSLKLNDSLINEIFECFFNGTKDYSINSKGDSGSRVREIAIEGLEKLIEMCAVQKLRTFIDDHQLITNILGSIMQQAVERIDRTRSIAGKIFSNLLYSSNLNIDKLAYIKTIRSVFKRDQCEMMDWNVAHITLPLFVQLFTINELQTYLLTGIIFSIGSLTESLVKSATSLFLKQLQLFFKIEDKIILSELIEKILNLCRMHLKNDRLSASLIKAVDLIIQNGFLNDEKLKKYPLEFLNLFLENVKITKDMQKLNSYVDLFCDMLQFNADNDKEKVRQRSMIQLMIMLCHQYPIIRKTTATKLFESFMYYPDLFEKSEDNDECVSLLVDTVWDEPIVKLRPIRNRICDLTKTPKPVLKSSASDQKNTDSC